MSFGKNSSSSQQQSQSTAQQQLDPQIKAALLQNVANFDKNVPGYTPYAGTTVADLTPQQQQSFGLVGDIANNQTGAAATNNAAAAAQGITGYMPSQVTANGATASLIDPSAVSNVTASTVGQTDLTPYLNPWTQNVVDATTASAKNALDQQLNQNSADATKLGAWRGNALAVQNGIATGQSNLALDQTIAELRAQGYTNAEAQAQADANRQLQAAQGNQQTQLAEGTTNANLGTQTALANAANALTAQTSNQSAGIAGANTRLSATQTEGALGQQQLTDALSRATALDQAGTQQQQQNAALLQWAYENNYLNPQQYAMAVEQLRNQTLGLAGNPVLGTSQSTSSGKGSSSGFSFGMPSISLSAGGGG